MRVRAFINLVGLCAAATLTGCGGSGSPGASPATASLSQAAPARAIGFSESGFVDTSFATTASIGVRLNGETATTNKSYGRLLGYAKGIVSKVSHVITLTRGQTVVFSNVDASAPHTASFLGDATKKTAPWPSAFNGSSTQSIAGTDISSAKFSTGALSPGTSSLKYVANVPGFYMFGCAFHYDAFGMRDIIIVR